jgi:calcineurin-like phosphoesterase family protein
MSTIWFTADLHLGHKLVAQERGFGDDTDAHDAHLAARWDSRVRPGDTVKVLGDLCIGRGMSHDQALAWIAQRPGIKDLIFGNHDSGHPMHREAHKHQASYLDVFRSAQESGVIRIMGQKVMMSHFPFAADHTAVQRYPEWRKQDVGQWLLHGHTHFSTKRDGRQLHVGLDAWGLAPVHISWIEAEMAKEVSQERAATAAPYVYAGGRDA